MGLVFLDTETGGLNPLEDELIEVAWATLANPEPKVIILEHQPNLVGKVAAEMNRYFERGLDNRDRWAQGYEVDELIDDLKSATVVGANTAFDLAFLSTYFDWSPDDVPWHYRSLDIESIAYKAFMYPQKVPGMKDIKDQLVQLGYTLPEPDHTAAGDVRTLIAAFEILREL